MTQLIPACDARRVSPLSYQSVPGRDAAAI